MYALYAPTTFAVEFNMTDLLSIRYCD